MNRKGLAKALAAQQNMTTQQTEDLIKTMFSIIETKMTEGEKILIRGFGRFESRSKPPTRRRNPRNGEMISVPQKYTVAFVPSPTLKTRVAEKIVNGEDNG